jgi:hypothetical protein
MVRQPSIKTPADRGDTAPVAETREVQGAGPEDVDRRGWRKMVGYAEIEHESPRLSRHPGKEGYGQCSDTWN